MARRQVRIIIGWAAAMLLASPVVAPQAPAGGPVYRQPRQAGGQQAIERGSKGSDGHLMCLSVCAQLLI